MSPSLIMLPVAVKVLALITFAPVMLPFGPVVVILGNVTLPEVLSVPDMFAPVPVTVIVVLPALVIVTLPLLVAILTLLLPLLIPVPVATDAQVNTPEPFVCRY